MASAPALLSFTKVEAPAATPQWRLTFSEPVTGLHLSDVAIGGVGTYYTGAQISGLAPTGDGSVWVLSVTAGPGEGQIGPSFNGSTVRDLDGVAIAGRYAAQAPFPITTDVPLITVDTNGDGLLDIVTGDSIRLGQGQGNFAAPVALTGGIAGGVPLAIDGNGDGRLDIVVSGASSGAFLAGLAGGAFAPGTPLALSGAGALIAAQLNGDGRADIVQVSHTGAVSVSEQLAGGGFSAPTTFTAASAARDERQVAVGDVNGDGLADLAVLRDTGVTLYLKQADLQFAAGTTYAPGLNSTGIWLADLNGDNKLDLLTYGPNVSVRLGDGAGGFGERLESFLPISDYYPPTASSYFPSSPVHRDVPVQAIRDVTGDGVPDLVGISTYSGFFWGNYYVNEAYVAAGRGDGLFSAPALMTNAVGLFHAFADLDNDGRYDFLTLQPATSNTLGGGSTPARWLATLDQVDTVYGDFARNYTPPHLLSITASLDGVTLARNDVVKFTLHFDKQVTFGTNTFLRLDNGGVATYDTTLSDRDLRFSYRAVDGEASTHLDVMRVQGSIANSSSGLPVDLTLPPPAVAGNVAVHTVTPLYFANLDGRLAAWQFDGLQVVDKILLSAHAGDNAAAILHVGGADQLLTNYGSVASVSSTATPGSFSTLGTAGGKWSFAGEGGSGGPAGRVFWYSNQGEVVFWDTGNAGSPRAWLGQASLDWRVAAIADTDGDGAADVIFQNQDGRVALWQVSGNAVTARGVIDVVTPDWKLVAAGDLNGDGTADLLYRNAADNRLVARFMNGFDGIGDNQVIGVASNDWSIADLRDMNGDGREDILWRNTSGDFAVWTMDGAHILSQQSFDKVSPDWVLLT